MAIIIAVASGKGGVGKTLITASLAISLQRRGHHVLAVDADMGLRNLDLMFGMQDDVLYDVGDVMKENCSTEEALLHITPQLDFLAASQKHTWEKIDAPSYQYIVEKLAKNYEYVLIDCPPGRGRAFKDAVAIADTIFFVIEPTWSSMRDAARVMQFCNKHKRFHYDVMFNNFYGCDPGYVSVQDMIQILNPETVAGILPHDAAIHAAAQQGNLISCDNTPFYTAMEQTAVYIETGTALDIPALLDLLPAAETVSVSQHNEEDVSDGEAIPHELGIMKSKATAELQKAAALINGMAKQTDVPSVVTDTILTDHTEKTETTTVRARISVRQRQRQSMAWRHYRR